MSDYLDLAEFKAMLFVTFNDDDAILQSYLDAAEQYIGDPENGILNRPVLQQTFTEEWQGFEGCVKYPDGVNAATITYTDTDGNTQTVPPQVYTVNGGLITLAHGQSWPAHEGPVTITYQAGWPAAQIPQIIRQMGYVWAAYQYRPNAEQDPEALKDTLKFMASGYRRPTI